MCSGQGPLQTHLWWHQNAERSIPLQFLCCHGQMCTAILSAYLLKQQGTQIAQLRRMLILFLLLLIQKIGVIHGVVFSNMRIRAGIEAAFIGVQASFTGHVLGHD